MFAKKTYITFCSAIMLSVISYAQTTIQSTIKSKQGNLALFGATVSCSLSQRTTLSNEKGVFILELKNQNQVIKISYNGYKTKEFDALKVPKIIYLESKLEALNQVVISASRIKEKKHDVPVAISVITKKKLEEMQPNDVSEVLNQKPGVLMVDLGNEQHMMAIRQPISTKSVFLYLEDGLPIRPTGIFNHNALLEMNASALEGIEIIRGAYSSLYGSEAIGGAVNFITQKPSEQLEISAALRANNIGYSRFDVKASTTLNDKTGIYLSAYKSQIKDGFRDYGDFNKKALTAKLTHKFTDKFSVENSLTYVDYYSQMSGSIGEDAYKSKDYSSVHTFTYRAANALRITSTFNYEWNDYQNSFVKFFYRSNSMEQNPTYRVSLNRIDGITYGELNDNDFDSCGILLQHNAIVNDSFKYSAGLVLDATNNDFVAEKLVVNQNSDGVYDSFNQTGSFLSDYVAKILNTGLFTSVEYKLDEFFRLNGGLRADLFRYDFNNSLGSEALSFSSPNSKNNFLSLTPRLGLVYNNKTNGWYLNYSRGFVPPSVGQLYKDSEIPDLEPSVFNNFEIGSFASFLHNTLYFDAAVYYLRGENEVISVTQDDGSRINDNAGETEHYGIEFLMEYAFASEFKLSVNQAFSKHRFVEYVERGNDYSGNDMSGAPQFNGSVLLTYKPNYLKGFNIGLELQALGSYYTGNDNDYLYKGHEFFNVRAGYSVGAFYVWANVLNVTDKLYANRASTAWGRTTFTPGAPRNTTVGLRYSFK